MLTIVVFLDDLFLMHLFWCISFVSNTFLDDLFLMHSIAFVSNACSLYTLKISENRKVFLCFQGKEKGCIGNKWVRKRNHCAKGVLIRIYPGPHIPAFGLGTERYGEILRISPYSVWIRENVDQNNSEYGHFLRSEC